MFLRQLVWTQPESVSCLYGWMGASSSNTGWRTVLFTRQTKSWNSRSYGNLMVGEEYVGSIMLPCFVVALARVTMNGVAPGRGSHQPAAANPSDALDCNRLSHLFHVSRPFPNAACGLCGCSCTDDGPASQMTKWHTDNVQVWFAQHDSPG